MNKTFVYYCEGEDDQKLIDALKVSPSKILSGKSKKLNVVQSLIPKSILLGIKPETNVALVFDTDVKTVLELTKSKSLSNFKTDFRKMKEEQCRNTLERHRIDVDRLWTTKAPDEFKFAERNSEGVKKVKGDSGGHV